MKFIVGVVLSVLLLDVHPKPVNQKPDTLQQQQSPSYIIDCKNAREVYTRVAVRRVSDSRVVAVVVCFAAEAVDPMVQDNDGNYHIEVPHK